jgi:putative ABC transport system permease protein
LPAASYGDPARVTQTFERLVDAAATLPRVETAAAVSQAPMGPGGNSNGLIPEGRAFDPRNAIDSRLRIITPTYFETMRVPIVRGRGFTAADRRGAPKVMIISEALARAAWPDQDPIGKRVACCEPGPDGTSPDWKIVVGVAGDAIARTQRNASPSSICRSGRFQRRVGVDSADDGMSSCGCRATIPTR